LDVSKPCLGNDLLELWHGVFKVPDVDQNLDSLGEVKVLRAFDNREQGVNQLVDEQRVHSLAQHVIKLPIIWREPLDKDVILLNKPADTLAALREHAGEGKGCGVGGPLALVILEPPHHGLIIVVRVNRQLVKLFSLNDLAKTRP